MRCKREGLLLSGAAGSLAATAAPKFGNCDFIRAITSAADCIGESPATLSFAVRCNWAALLPVSPAMPLANGMCAVADAADANVSSDFSGASDATGAYLAASLRMGNRLTTRSVKRSTNSGVRRPKSPATEASSPIWCARRRRNRRSGSAFKLIPQLARVTALSCRCKARRTHGERAASVRRITCIALRPKVSRGFTGFMSLNRR